MYKYTLRNTRLHTQTVCPSYAYSMFWNRHKLCVYTQILSPTYLVLYIQMFQNLKVTQPKHLWRQAFQTRDSVFKGHSFGSLSDITQYWGPAMGPTGPGFLTRRPEAYTATAITVLLNSMFNRRNRHNFNWLTSKIKPKLVLEWLAITTPRLFPDN